MLGASNRPIDGLYNYGYGGEDIIPFNPDKSLLMQFVKGNLATKLSYDHTMLSKGEISILEEWILKGAKDYKGDVPYSSPESYRVYVCNQYSEYVSVIDGTNKVVSHLTDVYNPATDFDTPYWVAEYGDYYYVTLSSAGLFVKFRKVDNVPVSAINGLSEPGIIRINKDGTKAYVSRAYTTETTYSSIYVLDLTNMFVIKELALKKNGLPHGIAIDNLRGFLFVADAINNLIHVVNIYTDLLIDTRFDLVNDFYPLFLAASPDGNYLYISAYNSNQLLVANAGSRKIISRVNLLSHPMDVTVSSNGQKIYIASSGGNAVEVVTKTAAFWDKTNTITHPAFSMPFALDITSDDNYLYVTNQNYDGDFAPAYQVKGEGNISTVSIINTQTEKVEKVIEIEEAAAGIVVEKL
jgi:YVTN family beta-propeller protein